MKGNAPLLLPAIVIATQSAREFRNVVADATRRRIPRVSFAAPSDW